MCACCSGPALDTSEKHDVCSAPSNAQYFNKATELVVVTGFIAVVIYCYWTQKKLFGQFLDVAVKVYTLFPSALKMLSINLLWILPLAALPMVRRHVLMLMNNAILIFNRTFHVISSSYNIRKTDHAQEFILSADDSSLGAFNRLCKQCNSVAPGLIRCIFSGPSGTGKTASVNELAKRTKHTRYTVFNWRDIVYQSEQYGRGVDGDISACVMDARSANQSMIACIDEVSAKSRGKTEQDERDRDVNVFSRQA